ncbi:lipid II flippase MurJ [Microtetraspora glauca]|uniref:Lipid II flippase MurJ n=1 Tax=Microtetraspora glauca TaxID=1996 RepID=A0ABV3GJL6_MICGL
MNKPENAAEQPRLAKAGRAMALATLVSRITGFGRTLALVAALGLGSRLLDAHTVANTLPNSIYDVVLGGALAGVLVPLLVRHGDEMFAQRLLSLIVYCLGITIAVTMLFAPQIVDLCAPGFTPDQRQLAITFTRFFLPQILFYGAGTALAAVLNARGRMASPMWAPVANNLVVIATAVAYLAIGGGHRVEELTSAQTLLLSVGTTAGVAAQMLLLAFAGRAAARRDLSVYGLALVPFCGYQIMIRGFYALQDTRTPALIGVLVSAVTAISAWAAAAIVPGPGMLVALAAGYALAGTVGLLTAAIVLRSRLGRVDGHRLLSTHTRTAIAAAGTGFTAIAITHALVPAIGTGWSGSLVILLAAGAAGCALYPLAGRLLRITELRVLLSALRPTSA